MEFPTRESKFRGANIQKKTKGGKLKNKRSRGSKNHEGTVGIKGGTKKTQKPMNWWGGRAQNGNSQPRGEGSSTEIPAGSG